MASVVLDPFQILLNNLSNELHERNLHSLIHVCGDYIPGGQRERISSGWDIFSILRYQNVIGSEPEKMINLLLIIKELKPKRRDLVQMIKRHIQEHYEQPEVILKDFESSDSNLLFPVISSRSSTPIPQEDCCRINCCCFACNYKPCCDGCCCCVILAIVFSFLAVAAALAWYCNIPELSKHLTSNDDLKRAGPYVVGFLGFLASCSVAGATYITIKRRLLRHDQSFSRLDSSHPSFPETSSIVASYAASDSTRSSHNSGTGRRIARSRRYSGSSGQFTASSSLASRASLRHTRLLDDAVPDGPQAEDYPEFFTQGLDQDDDAPIVV